jgi:hypothetical protein
MADPVATIQAVQQAEPALTAGLIALAFALLEVIKMLISWTMKKVTGKDKQQTLLVQLDPEVSSIVHRTGDDVKGISAIVTRVDADGVPLVYSDRKIERSVEKISETLERISASQTRLADSMIKLEQRFEMHDRSDAVTFARLSDSQERMEQNSETNRDSLIEIKQDFKRSNDVLYDIRQKVST